jgi:hypothetical protein
MAALPAVASAQLAKVGAEFQVNTLTLYDQSYFYGPQIGVSNGGDFVVIWQEAPANSIAGQRFDASGVPVGTEMQLRPPVSVQPSLAVGGNGNFILFWAEPDTDGLGVFGQSFDSSGAAQGAVFQVSGRCRCRDRCHTPRRGRPG